MNYFAHAIRHLDKPHFLAGLAVPDWMSVVDRRVRLRARRIQPLRVELPPRELEIADGILQHLDDDRWFHGTPAFFQVTGALAQEFRNLLGPDETWQCGFLGHIVCELLLDAELADRSPALLEDYYHLMERWSPSQIESLVNQLAEKSTSRLAEFIPLFVRERFLFDYLDDTRLLRRLNQVMKRVQLPQLPDETVTVLSIGRSIVCRELTQLLPREYFPELPSLVPLTSG